MNETEKYLRSVILRKQTYRRLFMDEDKLKPDAEVFFADLMRFCRWHSSITVVSPVSRQTDVPASFQAEGRREVLARILDHLRPNDAKLMKLENLND